MALICCLIFIYFCLYSNSHLHRAILIYGPLSILSQPYMCLRYNSPAILLSFMIELVLLLLYYRKNKKFYIAKFPLKRPFIFILIIQIIGTIVSPIGIMGTIPNVIFKSVSYLYIIIFFNELTTLLDMKLAIKSLLITTCVLGIYAIYEFIIQANPIMSYISASLPPEVLDGKLYYTEGLERFFSIRGQSLLTICISWGGFCCMIIAILFYLKGTKILRINNIAIFLLMLLFSFFILITGTRSAYLFLIFVFFGGFKTLNKFNQFLFIIIIAIFSAIFIDNLLQIVTSFNSDSDLTGSSIDMRMMQFEAVMNVITESPICGLGIKGYTVARDIDADILGAESVWMQTLITSGFLGIVCQLYLYYCLLKYINHNTNAVNKRLLIMVTLGWIAFYSLTTSPGLNETYFILIILLMCKLETNKKYNENICLYSCI